MRRGAAGKGLLRPFTLETILLTEKPRKHPEILDGRTARAYLGRGMRTRARRDFTDTVLALVNPRQVRRVPLRARIAWATAVGERALRLHPGFLKSYDQKPWIDYAWAFAGGRRDDPARRERLSARLDAQVERAERGRYSQEFLFVGIHVLEEIAEPDGASAQAAVEYAALLYGESLPAKLRKAGGDWVQLPFYEFAARTLEVARGLEGAGIARDAFESTPLHCPP